MMPVYHLNVLHEESGEWYIESVRYSLSAAMMRYYHLKRKYGVHNVRLTF